MQLAELRSRFFELITAHRPTTWEIDEYLEALVPLPETQQHLLLNQVPCLWPVSHALCYSYLAAGVPALACLESEQVSPWVAMVLDIYEGQGLRPAQHFMKDVEAHFLCRIRGEAGVTFGEIKTRLEPYARAIAAKEIELAIGTELHTNTETIFLPREVTRFPGTTENFLLYKLMITFQLGLLRGNTYRLRLAADAAAITTLARLEGNRLPTASLRLHDFFALFNHPRLAEDCFVLAETMRISRRLCNDFPGLWRDTEAVRHGLLDDRPQMTALAPGMRLLEACCAYVMGHTTMPGLDPEEQARYEQAVAILIDPGVTAADAALRATRLYAIIASYMLPAAPMSLIPYIGRLHPQEAIQTLEQNRRHHRDKFITALAAILPQQPHPAKPHAPETEPLITSPAAATMGRDGIALLPAANSIERPVDTEGENHNEVRFLTVDNSTIVLPVPLRHLAREIVADYGHIPNEYIHAAQGMAGSAIPTRSAASLAAGDSLIAPLTYDEWDFRRNGFRKDWCVLREKEITPVRGSFVEHTRQTHHGLLMQLKKQFELLRCQERFVKRQRDGDDIDLDAMIATLADTRAGRLPSDRLFIRLQRDERDIAALFLVDMSSSTEGWINQALKEALILMAEALEVLGDRYAMYGFSGMRRLRSDFYHVKHFDEPYNQIVQGRIAAIAPQDYTRMGPPLRHAVHLLRTIEARVRLLITLSDGKPEDYDDYKGAYAIEDTRHALIEAKNAGIHPFCITIDKQAHEYITHMYGEVNSICLDDVCKLPARLPEIYRNLTT